MCVCAQETYVQGLLQLQSYEEITKSVAPLAAISSKAVASLFGQATNQRQRTKLETAIAKLELTHRIQPTERWTSSHPAFKSALAKLVQRMTKRWAHRWAVSLARPCLSACCTDSALSA